MRLTIYLPDDLARAVNDYLRNHPETDLSALVREALWARLGRNPEALLELAGVVEKATGSAREGAEDRPLRGKSPSPSHRDLEFKSHVMLR